MQNQERSKVLLIDDDTSLLVMLGDFLRFEGYEVETADSGEEGLKRLESLRPDLIILDMSMPGMGGIGFLRAVSDADGRPRYPILVLTARANMAEFFADVEVDGFIAKPCETQDLLNEVARIIFLRKGNRQTERLPGTQPARVLLGEDDAVLAERLTHAMGEEGYKVEWAASGPEVLEKAIVNRPDVVVCKLIFRGMNGDVLATMLRDLPSTSGLPIVLYDDSGSAASEERYMRGGTRVKAVVRNRNPASIVGAVTLALAG
jgi:CheY-like chemotaxis protein